MQSQLFSIDIPFDTYQRTQYEFEEDIELHPATFSLFSSILDITEDTSTAENSPKIYRAISVPKYGIIDLEKLPGLCKTRIGSQKLQKMLSKCQPEDIGKIVSVLAPHVSNLMCDLYGNYLCQCLIKTITPSQRLVILNAIMSSLKKISKDPQGTHALQQLIYLCSSQQEENVYRLGLSGSVLELSRHPNASHVIQGLLTVLKDRSFILNEIKSNTVDLATDKLGLCVIKKCAFDVDIYNELLKNALELVQDPFGNYSIQQIITEERSHSEIYNKFKGNIAQLSIQKYASNVLEKCMHFESLRNKMIAEVLEDDKLQMILSSTYGCYILKTAADLACPELKDQMRVKASTLKPFNCQKKLAQKWKGIKKALSI